MPVKALASMLCRMDTVVTAVAGNRIGRVFILAADCVAQNAIELQYQKSAISANANHRGTLYAYAELESDSQ